MYNNNNNSEFNSEYRMNRLIYILNIIYKTQLIRYRIIKIII